MVSRPFTFYISVCFSACIIGGDSMMKGYWLGYGYMGYLPSDGMYHEFETEDEYKACYREDEEES